MLKINRERSKHRNKERKLSVLGIHNQRSAAVRGAPGALDPLVMGVWYHVLFRVEINIYITLMNE